MGKVFVHGLGQTPESWNEVLPFIGEMGGYVYPNLVEGVKNQNVNYKNLYKAFSELCDKLDEPIGLCNSMMELDFTDRLDNISCPVLIVCGEKDNANKKAAKELAMLLKDTRLEFVSGTGHEVNVEAPDKLGELLFKFYSSIEM